MSKGRYSLTIESGGNHLTAHAVGQRTLDTVTALAVEVVQAALAAGYSKILLDVTELMGGLALLENYLAAGTVLEGLRGNGLRQAAIVERGAHSLRCQDLETIGRNRGFNIRLCNSREDAVSWLEEP